MADRRVFDDRTMKALLEGYAPAGLDEKGQARLVDALHEAMRRESLRDRPGEAATPFKRFAPRVLAVAASLLALLGSALAYRTMTTVGTPWSVARAGALQGEPQTAAKTVRAGAEGPVTIETGNERITMEPGGSLAIRGDFLRGITGKRGNVYTLEEGRIALVHARGEFALETPWARIEPIGTALSAEVSPDLVRLSCDEGALSVSPHSGGRLVLDAGKSLVAKLENGRWSVSDGGPPRTEVPKESPAKAPFIESDPGKAPRKSLVDRTRTIEDAATAVPQARQPGFRRIWSVDPGAYPSIAGAYAAIAIDVESGTVLVHVRSKTDTSPDRIQVFASTDGRKLSEATLPGRYEALGFDSSAAIALSGTALSAFDPGDGALRWTAKVGPMGFGEFAVTGGIVYLPSADGNLYMVDAKTGSVIRIIRAGIGLYGKPLVSGGQVLACTISGELRAFDRASGALSWTARAKGRLVSARPVALGTLVVVADADGGILACALADGSRQEPPVIAGDVIAVDGVILAATGLYRDATGGIFQPMPIAAGAVSGNDAVLLAVSGTLEYWRFEP